MSELIETDGRSNTYKQTYQYYNGRYRINTLASGNHYVREDLGFEWVKKTIAATGEVEITYYRQGDPFNGQVFKKQFYAGNGKLKTETKHSYVVYGGCHDGDIDTPCEKHDEEEPMIVLESETVVKTYEPNDETLLNTTVSEMSYDNFGNLTSVVTTTDGNSIYAYRYVINDPISRNIGLLYETKLCSEEGCPDGGLISWQKQYYDDDGFIPGLNNCNPTKTTTPQTISIGGRGLVTRNISYIDGVWSATCYEHDKYGNIVKILYPDGTSKTKKYDNVYQIHVVEATNTEGDKTSTTYDYRWGLPKVITDPNGLNTEIDYDEFGRPKIKRLTSNGKLLQRETYLTNLSYSENYDLHYFKKSKWLKIDDAGYDISVYEYRDGLGRVYKKKVSSPTGAGFYCCRHIL